MKRLFCACWVVLVMCGPKAGQLGAEVELPKAIKAIIPVYPNSTVITAFETKDGSQAVMEGKGEPKEVVSFYKKHLEPKGWEIQMEMSQKTSHSVILKKGQQTLSVVADSSSKGKTSVAVILGK